MVGKSDMASVIHILHGWLYWRVFSIIHNISYKKVLLVLNNENPQLDKEAVQYLRLFVERKSARSSIIVWTEQSTKKWLDEIKLENNKIVYLPIQKIELLYDYYCFEKFFDNIVFTYTSKPNENLLGRILSETDIDERDAVCLALYHLRYVPKIKVL